MERQNEQAERDHATVRDAGATVSLRSVQESGCPCEPVLTETNPPHFLSESIASGSLSGESVLHILRLILSGAPLDEVLVIVAHLIEARGEGMLCTIWMVDEDGKSFRCAAAPSLPKAYLTSLVEFIRARAAIGLAIGPASASCGAAIYKREPVYVSDIPNDPIWADYRHLTAPYGLCAAWSKPLLSKKGEVMGTFAVYYREKRSPKPFELELIENVSQVAGIAIERYLAEQERNRFAHDLHDTLLQSIDASKLAIENALSTPDDIPLMQHTLQRSLSWLKRASREGRATLDEIYDDSTEIADLAEALQYAADDALRNRNMFSTLVVTGEPARLRPIISNEVYRIAQEAIRNAGEHSQGRRMDITLAYGDQFELRIKDNGSGFKLDRQNSVKNGHFGIKAMQDRTSRIGGTITWESCPSEGTAVLLTLPGEIAYEANLTTVAAMRR